MLASEQRYLAEIILTQLTIKVPNFGPKNSNFACSPKFSEFHFKYIEKSQLRSRSRDFCQIFEGSVSVSKNLVSEKKSRTTINTSKACDKSGL